MQHIQIAIDGPSGAGKSTISKAIAARLGIVYVDTGALYRTVGYYARSQGISLPAIAAVVLGGANIYGGSGSIIGTAIAVLLVGYLQQGLQMAGVPNQVSSALSGALLIVVVVGRSVSLHRQQIKEWLARRANNPLP